MRDMKDYLEQTNTVLLTKDAFEHLKERASALDKIRAEIKAASHGKRYVGRVDGKTEEVLLMDEVMEIIDKYRKGEK